MAISYTEFHLTIFSIVAISDVILALSMMLSKKHTLTLSILGAESSLPLVVSLRIIVG